MQSRVRASTRPGCYGCFCCIRRLHPPEPHGPSCAVWSFSHHSRRLIEFFDFGEWHCSRAIKLPSGLHAAAAPYSEQRPGDTCVAAQKHIYELKICMWNRKRRPALANRSPRGGEELNIKCRNVEPAFCILLARRSFLLFKRLECRHRNCACARIHSDLIFIFLSLSSSMNLFPILRRRAARGTAGRKANSRSVVSVRCS